MPPTFLYLHGFASGPSSSKGVFLKQQLAHSYNIDLQIPDFNEGGFTYLTVSRQIEQVCDRLSNSPVILIGSSLGGLTAAWVAETMPQVKRAILLAPAFEFARRWRLALGEAAIESWQEHGMRSFFHYGQQAELPLHYRFVEDALKYDEVRLKRPVPTAIVHGRRDEVVPVQVSRQFAGDRDWVELQELDSDHALGDEASKTAIWDTVQRFCGLA